MFRASEAGTWGCPEQIPAIIAVIGYWPQGDSASRIRHAQQTFCNEDPRATCVNMYDLSRNYHFDATTFLISGHRMAEAYIDLAKVYVPCGEASIAAGNAHVDPHNEYDNSEPHVESNIESKSEPHVESNVEPHVDALLGYYLVAIAAGALCLFVVLVWARRARNAKFANADAVRSNYALRKSSVTKGALGVEALDADGSGTLGNFTIYGGADGGDDETYGEEGEAVPEIV